MSNDSEPTALVSSILPADTASSEETTDRWSGIWTVLPVVALVFMTATLYRGRDIFLPIVTALILAVIFAPLVNFLEAYIGRLLSTAIVVLLALFAIFATALFLTTELTAVANQVAGYSANIGNKLAALEKTSPPWLQHLKSALSDIQRRIQIAGTDLIGFQQ